MKKTLVALLVALFALSSTALTQNTNNSSDATNTNASANANAKSPIFRATKEQIKQAQLVLKQRNLYSGAATGKLDADTRAALKKYQEAETLKPTGTLNRLTLEKMNITLTDKQKSWPQTGNKNAM